MNTLKTIDSFVHSTLASRTPLAENVIPHAVTAVYFFSLLAIIHVAEFFIKVRWITFVFAVLYRLV